MPLLISEVLDVNLWVFVRNKTIKYFAANHQKWERGSRNVMNFAAICNRTFWPVSEWNLQQNRQPNNHFFASLWTNDLMNHVCFSFLRKFLTVFNCEFSYIFSDPMCYQPSCFNDQVKLKFSSYLINEVSLYVIMFILHLHSGRTQLEMLTWHSDHCRIFFWDN